jgi:hypothetical protein
MWGDSPAQQSCLFNPKAINDVPGQLSYRGTSDGFSATTCQADPQRSYRAFARRGEATVPAACGAHTRTGVPVVRCHGRPFLCTNSPSGQAAIRSGIWGRPDVRPQNLQLRSAGLERVYRLTEPHAPNQLKEAII